MSKRKGYLQYKNTARELRIVADLLIEAHYDHMFSSGSQNLRQEIIKLKNKIVRRINYCKRMMEKIERGD